MQHGIVLTEYEARIHAAGKAVELQRDDTAMDVRLRGGLVRAGVLFWNGHLVERTESTAA